MNRVRMYEKRERESINKRRMSMLVQYEEREEEWCV